MNLSSFRKSLEQNDPPDVSVYLKSLWYDAKGDWNQAHDLIQEVHGRNSAWIHAYLHRKEGDTPNADYWYNKAGKKRPAIDLQEEWEQIVVFFC